jgi:phosphopantothenoylcysteine decarboxylase/phosphopantothenate--cysteine ligase
VAEGGGPLTGRRILVRAGPPHEPIDAVRFIGNRSSGKMGYAVAREAAKRGAGVTLVSGPTNLPDPPGVETIRVETAEEMREAVLARLEDADAVVKAAAVADWRTKERAEGKMKKESGPPDLLLEPTPDILRELGERKGNRVLIGFAAETPTETATLAELGAAKLARKGCDALVINDVSGGKVFGSSTSEISVFTSTQYGDGRHGPWAGTKDTLAHRVLDIAVELRARR